jgi:hypothetical protein
MRDWICFARHKEVALPSQERTCRDILGLDDREIITYQLDLGSCRRNIPGWFKEPSGYSLQITYAFLLPQPVSAMAWEGHLHKLCILRDSKFLCFLLFHGCSVINGSGLGVLGVLGAHLTSFCFGVIVSV